MNAIKILEDELFKDELVRQMAVDIETHSPLSYCEKILSL